VLQLVEVCRGVLLCVAVCCCVLQCVAFKKKATVFVLCYSSVLLRVAVCSSVQEKGDGIHAVLQCVTVCCSVLQCVAVCCSMLQSRKKRGFRCCFVVCYSVLQHVAVCFSVL